jgi:phosphoglycolate phosphatase
MQPTVVLFDIDGTLVTCGGAGRASMERAFAEVLGRPDVVDFPFGGMTDRGIARAGLTSAGREASDAAMAEVIAVYLRHLEDELPRAPRYRVLDGVARVLDRLEPLAHVAVGLGTGNVEAGARIKLARGELWHRFAFGGFGSDAEDRAELLACGAERGRARLGVSSSTARVVVIGDTPRDVSAARAIGAEVIAVATGSFTREQLALHAPDLLVERLDDERVAAALFT